MHDARVAVPAFTGQFEVTAGRPIEPRTESPQAVDRTRAALDHTPHHRGIGEAAAGLDRVVDVVVEGVIRGEDRGDAPLGPGRVRDGRRVLRHDGDRRPTLGGSQGSETARGPRAENDHVEAVLRDVAELEGDQVAVQVEIVGYLHGGVGAQHSHGSEPIRPTERHRTPP